MHDGNFGTAFNLIRTTWCLFLWNCERFFSLNCTHSLVCNQGRRMTGGRGKIIRLRSSWQKSSSVRSQWLCLRARWVPTGQGSTGGQSCSGTAWFTTGDTQINGRHYGEKLEGMVNVTAESPGKYVLREAALSDDCNIPFLKQSRTPMNAGDKKGWIYLA